MTQDYIKRLCAICQIETSTKKVVEANLDFDKLNAKTFSARRVPDRLTFQWVVCNNCGLYISSPYLAMNFESMYSNSELNYRNELKNLKITYRKLLNSVFPREELGNKSLLDVGAGNGFVLEVAKQMGFGCVKGIEPSANVVDEAEMSIKKDLKIGFISRDSFDKESFSLISMFHVLDHLPDPKKTLQDCRKLLQKNGQIVVAVHNTKSFSCKLLRGRSPIFDIEHTYLFNKITLKRILEEASFEVEFSSRYWNRYSLEYFISLLPLGEFKSRVIERLRDSRLGSASLWLPLGNIYAQARKVD